MDSFREACFVELLNREIDSQIREIDEQSSLESEVSRQSSFYNIEEEDLVKSETSSPTCDSSSTSSYTLCHESDIEEERFNLNILNDVYIDSELKKISVINPIECAEEDLDIENASATSQNSRDDDFMEYSVGSASTSTHDRPGGQTVIIIGSNCVRNRNAHAQSNDTSKPRSIISNEDSPEDAEQVTENHDIYTSSSPIAYVMAKIKTLFSSSGFGKFYTTIVIAFFGGLCIDYLVFPRLELTNPKPVTNHCNFHSINLKSSVQIPSSQ